MTVPSSSREVEQVISFNASDNSSRSLSILDALQVVVDNLRLLVALPIVVGLAAYALSFALTPIFTATTRFLPPQQQQGLAASALQSLGALGGLAAGAGGLKNPSDQYVALLKSQSVQDPLIEQFKLLERFDQPYRQDARTVLEKRTRVTSGKDGLLIIDFEDKDPAIAAAIANAYVTKLGDLLGRLAITEAQQRRLFFQKQLAEAKENLIKSEQALKATGISSSVLRVTPQSAIEGIARLQAQITTQEIKIAGMRGYLASGSPDLRQAQIELAALSSQLVRAQQEVPQVASDGGNDYVTRFREFKYNETLFEMFARQYELARVDESREGVAIQVVDAAQIPEKRSSPKRALIAIGSTVGAFVLLLIFVFARRSYAHATEDASANWKLKKIKSGLGRAFWRKG